HNDTVDVFHQPPGEFVAGRVVDAHEIAGLEFAGRTDDTFREQALAAFANGRARAVVHNEGAGRALEKGNPTFPAFKLAGTRNKQRAGLVARQRVADDHRNAGTGDDFGGFDFGSHAADAGVPVRAAGQRDDFGRDFGNDRDDLLTGIEKAGDMRKNDE